MKTKTLHSFLSIEREMEELAELALDRKDFKNYARLTKSLCNVRLNFLMQLDKAIEAEKI